MDIKSLHHVAYRCKDAKQTTEFYTKVLGLEYAMAMAEDRVPSTGEQSPYMHIFFRMDDGSYQTVRKETHDNIRVGDRVRVENGQVWGS